MWVVEALIRASRGAPLATGLRRRRRARPGAWVLDGHSHVDSAPLFDPEHAGRPPDDVWDLYFHAPISLSLLGDAYGTHGMERELGQLLSLYAGLATATVIDVRRQRDGRERRPWRADHAPAPPCPRGRAAIALQTSERHPALVPTC